jgi:predicted amidophosphoribosyltransferase
LFGSGSEQALSPMIFFTGKGKDGNLDQEKQKKMRETREPRKLTPASSCAMALLHAPKVGETSERCCAVCHDDFKEGDTLRTMPCAHSFHERCIFRSLRVHHLCPVCDYELPTNEEAVVLEACARAGSELFRFFKVAGLQISRSFVPS